MYFPLVICHLFISYSLIYKTKETKIFNNKNNNQCLQPEQPPQSYSTNPKQTTLSHSISIPSLYIHKPFSEHASPYNHTDILPLNHLLQDSKAHQQSADSHSYKIHLH